MLKDDAIQAKEINIVLFQNDSVIIRGITKNDCVVNQYRHYFHDGMIVK